MAAGGRGFGRSYPKEFLALETQLREAAPLVQGLLNGVPHARVRAAAALGAVVDACRRAADEAAALRAKRPASPSGPPASQAAKQPRAAPAPLADDPAREAWEAALTAFYDSAAGRAAVAAVEGATAEWRNPTISHVIIPLHTLWTRVRAAGGFDAVGRNKQWNRIAHTFGDFNDKQVGSKVKAAYSKYLLAFENGARAPAAQGGASGRRDASPSASPRRPQPSPRAAAAAAAMARAAGAGGGPVPQPSPLRPAAQPTAGRAPLPLHAKPKAAARQGTLFGAFAGGAKAAPARLAVQCSNRACGIKMSLMPGTTSFKCGACETHQDVAMEID